MTEQTKRTGGSSASYPKTAACACGALTVTATAPPQMIHACACLNCQRGTGSAFSYSAFFPESVVTVGGQARRWRRSSEAGRWQDCDFCPTCGVTVLSRLEVLPGIVCVGAGGFADPDFPGPGKLYWSSRRHHWLDVPNGVEPVETQ
jgi:hypothetical protein